MLPAEVQEKCGTWATIAQPCSQGLPARELLIIKNTFER